MPLSVAVIGAGLAGCEAALRLANKGLNVILYDQKPNVVTGAYSMHSFAELVCNNSLGTWDIDKPLGLLIAELKRMNSELIGIAMGCAVQDKRYFAINKKLFSEQVSRKILGHNNIIFKSEVVSSLPDADIIILASGPMTNEYLLREVARKYGISSFHFSDSSCTIIDITSIDLDNPCIKKISDDLYAIVIPNDIFQEFAYKLEHYYRKDINKQDAILECQPIEKIACSGVEKLSDLRFSHQGFPRNCLLLRREGALDNGYIMVGCMTNLRHSEQMEVFSILPGFSKMHILKYGRMHKNTYFNTPGYINHFFNINKSNIYIIGQLSGLDGYVPAIASGYIASQRIIYGDILLPFPLESMMGSLANYVCNINVVDYQPMCASFALIQSKSVISKSEAAMKAINLYKDYISNIDPI